MSIKPSLRLSTQGFMPIGGGDEGIKLTPDSDEADSPTSIVMKLNY